MTVSEKSREGARLFALVMIGASTGINLANVVWCLYSRISVTGPSMSLALTATWYWAMHLIDAYFEASLEKMRADRNTALNVVKMSEMQVTEFLSHQAEARGERKH